MSKLMRGKLIHSAAGLLCKTPSTDRDDYPRIPQYYLREVFNYTDRARLAAILMREASDYIGELRAEVAGSKAVYLSVTCAEDLAHIAGLEEALKDIAMQHLCDEMSDEETQSQDCIEFAYDMIIKIAREALEKTA